MYKIGQKVYHRSLNKEGVFNGYDKYDKDTCYFVFIDKHGFEEERRVSIDKLDSIKEKIDNE